MPQVSVIIPNLNNARYIEASIMSVLNQTLKDIEIIVIDDGSTDESWEIIQKLSQEDPRIITIKNPQNIGTGPSRNKGLDIATGEYIKFLDADDTMDSDVLESMYTAAQEHNAQIVCGYMRFCDSISWDEPLRPSEIIGEEKLICPDDQGSEFVFEQMGVGDGLYAASLFNGVRFPNLKWEDLATIPILKYKAGQIFYMDKAVYNYYMNNNSTTLTDHTKKTPRIRDVFDCITILRNGIPQEYSDRIDYLEFLHIFERISEIMNWDDCSRENKEKLISALHQFFQIDVPNYIENPFISCESLSYIRKLSQQHSVTQSLDVNPLIDYIGKSIDHEIEGSHVQIGSDIAHKYHESDIVINTIESHHGDTSATSVIAVIVAIADALSASRPGARNDSLENYVKRLQELEGIAKEIDGVDNAYALQAGREIRVVVKPDKVDDLGSFKIARDIKNDIEEKLQYPGTIKVTVIRETRAEEVAK